MPDLPSRLSDSPSTIHHRALLPSASARLLPSEVRTVQFSLFHLSVALKPIPHRNGRHRTGYHFPAEYSARWYNRLPTPPAVVPNPDIQYLVDRDLVATLPSKIYMLLQCLESCKDIAGNFRQESGKPDGSLSIGQVPEIDLPLADMGQGPGPPYTVMMIMIGRLHARQHLSLWRPYRVYESRTFE